MNFSQGAHLLLLYSWSRRIIRHLISISLLLALSANSLEDFYATLPKFGTIRGVRTSGEPGVVAFLGLPYANAPVGVLRFMPPGGLSSSGAQQLLANNGQLERRLLMPAMNFIATNSTLKAGNQMNHSTLQRAIVRPATQFGRECVRLSNWLQESRSQSNSPRATTHQSEDCLNLNVFVPLNESTTHDHLMSQQIKSNYPSQSHSRSQATNTTSQILSPIAASSSQHNHHSGGGASNQNDNQDLINQDKLPAPLLPILSHQQQAAKLPVLVLFHGFQTNEQTTPNSSSMNKANSFNYLPVVKRTNALVITFNYRIGLLGFLPYVDSEDRLLRLNHAIWDQIGLLHWLKHNVAYFGGDAHNVTLLALDNHASLFIQLLSMSSQSKGLFKRVILVNEGDSNYNETNLSKLLLLSREARDLRRRLSSLINETIERNMLNSIQPEAAKDQSNSNQKGFHFLLTANLTQLAQLEQKLEQVASNEILSLAFGPALDDKLLFPHLSQLIKHLNPNEPLEFDLSYERAQINYCLYLRQLYADNSTDPLGLVPKYSHFNRIDTNISNDWHRDTNNQLVASSSSSHRRSMSAVNFNHLHNIQQLALLLGSNITSSKQENYLNADDEEEENDESLSAKQSRLIQKLTSASLSLQSFGQKPMRIKKRSNDEQLNELMSQLSSIDIMFGYFKYLPPQSSVKKVTQISHYKNIASNLLNLTNMEDESLSWLRWIDLSFISNMMTTNNTIEKYCDIFSSTAGLKFKNFAFVVEADSNNNKFKKQDWLIDSMDEHLLASSLSDFIKYGNPNHDKKSKNSTWPAYDSLNHFYKHFSKSPTRGDLIQAPESLVESMERNIQVHLDLLQYLNSLNNTNYKITSYTDESNNQPELLACLEEIEGELKENGSFDVRCLFKASNGFRNQLRQYAAEDLEPLIKFSRQQTDLLNLHQSGTSLSITTRNLVAKDILYEQNSSNHHQMEDLANGTVLVAYVSPKNSQSKVEQGNEGADLRSFFAKTYKESMGKALTIVIGTGVSILILNLLIVLIITLRSAHSRRRTHQVAQSESRKNNSSHQNSTDQINVEVLAKRSSIKNSNGACNSSKGKQLKFDLPTSEPGNVVNVDNLVEDCTRFMGTNEYEMSSFINSNENSTFNCDENEEKNVLFLGEQTDELLLNPVLSVCNTDSTATIQYQPESNGDYYHQHHHHHQSCPAHKSQNLSPYTSTTVSSSDTCKNQLLKASHHHHHHHLVASNQYLNSLQLASYSATSPESSTTLSATPIQLEHQNSTNTIDFMNPANFAYHNQLMEPIGLIYEAGTNDFTSTILPYSTENNNNKFLYLAQQEDTDSTNNPNNNNPYQHN